MKTNKWLVNGGNNTIPKWNWMDGMAVRRGGDELMRKMFKETGNGDDGGGCVIGLLDKYFDVA